MSSTLSAIRSVGKSSPTTSPNPNPSTMSKPSTQLRFEDVYESFRVASPVSLFQQQESGPGHPTIDISGRRCLESYERLAPPMSWRRTFAASLVGMKGWFSTRCALTWKVKATKSFRSYFLLQVSTRRTAATESGLWLGTPTAGLDQGTGRSTQFRGNRTPTPLEFAQSLLPTPRKQTANSPCIHGRGGLGLQEVLLLTPTTREEPVDLDKFKARMEKYPNGTTMPNLATQVQQMLPTPRAVEFVETPENFSKRNGDRTTNSMPNLSSMAQHVPQMLPTPMAQESDKITGKENQDSLTKRARQETGKTSQLSPLFVEEMMGFPKGWTASPFQSGEESQ